MLSRSACLALLAFVSALGCYGPKIESGQLRCALVTSACPDGFACAGGLCVSNAGAGGAGGSPMCENAIQPLCAEQVSSPCDPVCQTGCACGERCEVSPGGLKCASVTSSIALGAVCDPDADACAPGLACLMEACGANLGRCYRLCRDDLNDLTCGTTGVCGTPVLLPDGNPSGQRVCDLGSQPCDPYARTGCVDPALNCYVTGPNQATCDCPTTSGPPAKVGDACTTYNGCDVGLACLQFSAGGPRSCVKLCETATDCPGSACLPFGSVSYCMAN
ncbi:MAG TPA: hypothetical protein VGP07_19530 [Polyangia bacterium]|jgi:hypothetical protein